MIGLVALLAATFLVLAAGTARADGPPRVVASIKPVHSIAAAVMKGAGEPQLLLSGAASPHSYALKPSDARKLADAELVFWIGPAFETFLTKPIATLAPDASVVTLAEAAGVRLLSARRGGLWQDATNHEHAGEAEDGFDGHVWLDTANAAAMAQAMADALGRADPENAEHYASRAERFALRMQALDDRIGAILAPVRGRPYIVFHDAYRYFEARYGLRPAGAVAVSPDRPVPARRIAELRGAIRASGAICVFSEPQFPPRLLDTLTAGTSAKRGVLDPLGAGLAEGPGLYDALILGIANALADCLGASL